MKQIFLSAMMASFILCACNNGTSTDSNATTGDSSKANVDNTSARSDSSAGAGNMTSGNNGVSKATVKLSPDQEVPANTSKASGTAEVAYNKDTKMLSYTVNYSGLTGNATMAHIHGTAPKGVNAGVKHDLTPVLKKSTSGSFTDSVKVDGSMIKEDSLMSGFYYINVHTPAHPAGEIRGQIELNKQ